MQTYFRLSLVPPKIMSANSSQRLISVTSKLLFCCWTFKFTDRIWYSHTCAMLREPVINLFAMSYECHRNSEEDFNFWGFFALQGKRFQWRKDKGVWKKYNGHSVTDSAFNWSWSVRLLAILKHDTFACDVTYLWPEFSCNKDVLGRFNYLSYERWFSVHFSQQIGWFSTVLHLYKVLCRPTNLILLVNYGLRSARRNHLFSQWWSP